MKKLMVLTLLITCLFTLKGLSTDNEKALQLINQTLETIDGIETLAMTIEMDEAVDNELTKKKGAFKIAYNPFRVYLYQIIPQEGMQILYVEGANNNKAVVKTNGFPWVKLYLDPLGSTMREGHHHSIYNSGFDFIAGVIRYMKDKYSEQYLLENLSYSGQKMYNGSKVHIVEFLHPKYGYKKYNILKDQTVEDLSRMFYVSGHKIIEKNGFTFDADDNLKGKTLEIPQGYAPKIVFYIHPSLNLPVRITVYDENGLYEDYQYSDITINPTFKDNEFSTEFPEYGFCTWQNLASENG